MQEFLHVYQYKNTITQNDRNVHTILQAGSQKTSGSLQGSMRSLTAVKIDKHREK